jgi:hypothetical protein
MSATYFAQVTDGVVTDVRAVTAEFMADNPERYLGIWIETFIGVQGKTYAGIGYTWNGVNFVSPQPFASWSLDANNDWQAPTPKPEGNCYWDEESLSWLAIPVG